MRGADPSIRGHDRGFFRHHLAFTYISPRRADQLEALRFSIKSAVVEPWKMGIDDQVFSSWTRGRPPVRGSSLKDSNESFGNPRWKGPCFKTHRSSRRHRSHGYRVTGSTYMRKEAATIMGEAMICRNYPIMENWRLSIRHLDLTALASGVH